MILKVMVSSLDHNKMYSYSSSSIQFTNVEKLTNRLEVLK